ncbi:hypothetical protein SH1V18_41660 [Vallitalea longa]|uniref:AAA+ ATPase domain-containing protein n=1 Tax=Vallitalea longa TaxID=2936439 RepID=A0A9W5YFF0_9FIRM|nr:ATP-binding protein [Vallitalea longa]GKX31686.1 hypothetical protein SH1V18_41660 [Vallitalea longa]
MELLSKQLDQLIIYNKILDDPIVEVVYNLLDSITKQESNDISKKLFIEIHRLLIVKAENEGLTGNLWKHHLSKIILLDENPFTLSSELYGNSIGKSIYEIATHDLKILKNIYNIDWAELATKLDIDYLNSIKDYQPTINSNFLDSTSIIIFLDNMDIDHVTKNISDFHYNNGCGIFITHNSFRWDNRILPILNPDPISFSDLYGFELQRKTLIKNTKAFLQGKKANNILLVGHRGTGKSSSVKALVNEYHSEGLRIVEINKHQLSDYHLIIKALKNRKHKFIIFMDDLSFEDFEVEYKNMKAIIEGGVEVRPDNVLIYATSNRRHLIKETWKDREGGDVHAMDSIEEKLSLSDRFGITITYNAPNQDKYLEIVKGMASKHNIDIPWEELRQKAIKWELWHNGRSGRSAQQFITSLLGEI